MKNAVLAKASDELVLILDYCWMPLAITSVRVGVGKLACHGSKNQHKPKVKSINRHGEPVCWEDWVDSSQCGYYENQPYIASPSQIVPVPTILLTTSHFYHASNRLPKITYLYKKYKGICQICGDYYPIDNMTIEHVFPRSFGGTLDWFNVTLTCKRCNTKKGQAYPYLNYKGEELSGTTYTKLDKLQFKFLHREEWGPYIFKE